MHVGRLVQQAAEQYGSHISFVSGAKQYTWRATTERVNALAHAFQQRGVQKGNRIAILSRNCPEYLEAVFAAASVGAVIVPCNYRLRPAEIEYLITDSEPVLFVVGDEYLPLVGSLREKLPSVHRYISVGNSQLPWAERFEALVAVPAASPPQVDVAPDDLATICYTSGTTGFPKGAMLSHRNLVSRAANFSEVLCVSPADRAYVAPALFHIAGLGLALAMVYAGAAQVILPQFEVQSTLAAIVREKVTVCVFVPSMIIFLLQHPKIESYNFSSLRHMDYGGAPMPFAVIQRAKQIFGCEFSQVFGQTEDTPHTALSPADHAVADEASQTRLLQSIGRELSRYCRLRVVNENEEDVAPGEIGELLSQGVQVMMGYWRRPRESEGTLRGGWLHTGDLVSRDADGYFYLMGRKKDMIISGGENVYPAEVEDVLYRHPKILEAAVIGVPHELWGETVKAVVVLREGLTASSEEIIAFCAERLASFKKPTSVEFVDTLPHNAAGKVLKAPLRERFGG